MFNRVLKHITWSVKIYRGPSDGWRSWTDSASFLLSNAEKCPECDDSDNSFYSFQIRFNFPESGDIVLAPSALEDNNHGLLMPKLLRLTIKVLDQIHGKDDMIETMECKVGERDVDGYIYNNLVLKNVTTPESRFIKDGKLLLVLIYSDPDPDAVNAEMETETDDSTETKSTDDIVILRTFDGGELQASCSELSQNSIVFDRMFTNDMQEKATRSVDIKEFSAAAMRAFLSFIKNDAVQSLGIIDMELYEIGEVYQVDKLKLLCSDSLASRVTDSEHASEILQFAVWHEELFDRCCITLACFYPTKERLLNFVEKFLSYELQAKVFKILFLKSTGGLGHEQLFVKIGNYKR